MDIKVSVVVPVYNAANFLENTLKSISGQTLREIEIICVDDGSEDNSYEMLTAYAEIEPRMIVLRHLEKTEGAAEARNIGLNYAKGKYVSFLDADDFFEPEMLEKAYRRAEDTYSQIVMYDGWAYDSISGLDYCVSWILNKSNIPDKDVFSSEDNPAKLYLMNSGAAWNNLYLKKFLIEENIRFFSTYITDDQVFVHLAYSCADRISILPERLIHYRKNNNDSQVANATKHPEAGYMASLALKNELAKRGILEKHRKALVNLAIVNAVVYLRFMKTEKSFEFLYYKLKNEIFNSLGLYEVEDEDYVSMDLVRKRNWITNLSPVQYLINVNYIDEDKLQFVNIYSRLCKVARIAIYGAGNYGKRFYDEIYRLGIYKLVGWFDRNAEEIGFPIMSPTEICAIDFDFLVIAIESKAVFESVKISLLKMGIARKKILWLFEPKE